MIHPQALVILDGFGYSPNTSSNACFHAHTPHLDKWSLNFYYTQLYAHGQFVGLLPEAMGNSEVGHYTIGAGRRIPQIAAQASHFFKKSILDDHKNVNQLIKNFNYKKSVIHLIGMISNGGIHSDINQIKEVLHFLGTATTRTVVMHAILDGRDSPPQSSISFIQEILATIQPYQHIHLGSVHGRFYAMDRDNNWERTEQTIATLYNPNQKQQDPIALIQHFYDQHIFDEFIPPTTISPIPLSDDDAVWIMNFRADRMRQLTKKLITTKHLAWCATPIIFDTTHTTIPLLQQNQPLTTLKHELASHNKTIFSIAETEKYAHITYFFNGGAEQPVTTETRHLIPSIKTKTYSTVPHMSAHEITQTILKTHNNPYDFYLINYANADMVGHTGNFQATQKAVECLDAQLKKLYDFIVTKHQGTLYITADHGNAEYMYNTHIQQPCTSHTTNKVPFWLIGHKKNQQALYELADIAPCILDQMNLPIPQTMTGHYTNLCNTPTQCTCHHQKFL